METDWVERMKVEILFLNEIFGFKTRKQALCRSEKEKLLFCLILIVNFSTLRKPSEKRACIMQSCFINLSQIGGLVFEKDHMHQTDVNQSS